MVVVVSVVASMVVVVVVVTGNATVFFDSFDISYCSVDEFDALYPLVVPLSTFAQTPSSSLCKRFDGLSHIILAGNRFVCWLVGC